MPAILLFSLLLSSSLNTAAEVPCPLPVLEHDLSGFKKFLVNPVKRPPEEARGVQFLNPTSYRGKVVIFRIFSTDCLLCLRDLAVGSRSFDERMWDSSEVVRVLLFYRGEGSGGETMSFQSVSEFVNGGYRQGGPFKSDPTLELGELEFFMAPLHLEQLKKIKGSSGSPLFPNVVGTPYSLVLDQKGRVRHRGYLLPSGNRDDVWNQLDQHYDRISELLDNPQCPL